MKLQHIALCCSTEETADRFYRDLLGLQKMAPKNLPPSLSRAIFDMDSELTVINYQNDTLRFEIFIHNTHRFDETPIAHTCIEVIDRKVFLNKCREMDVMIREVPKDDKMVIFICDFDGNLFEVT
jgi:catechol 2,3-dioxygenase-like lactoylglutathione lyase family enzyme